MTLVSYKLRNYGSVTATSATFSEVILEILFESLAMGRLGDAKTACCSLMCIIEIMIYVRTVIILLVAVDKLMGETVVTSPLGSHRPSTIHLSDVEG